MRTTPTPYVEKDPHKEKKGSHMVTKATIRKKGPHIEKKAPQKKKKNPTWNLF